MKKKVIRHLKEDIKSYKHEADKDRKLITELKKGKKKSTSCPKKKSS